MMKYRVIKAVNGYGETIYVAAKHTDDLYDTVRCTDYHVTQKISEKGDTTYVIKYKPL